ncbi:MAG TPA: NRDE family protein [Candidatus Eisenbacteria bacterium]|nr:NRDE family protein [Candidatus Eisenbacteria bacterium]
MCTLSFLPVHGGYVAAMNRDEERARPLALLPAVHSIGELNALYPREAGGGTWIGANGAGTLFGLLNWYARETENLPKKARSRGEVIPHLLGDLDAATSERALWQLDLEGIHPFRLIGVYPGERQIREWRWDARQLVHKSHDWGRQHWFSSSRSDTIAERERGAACERTWRGEPNDPAIWLRTLHSGHIPEPGPFSICVHRADAATVSYTEVIWDGTQLQMRYLAGNPCQAVEMPGAWTLPVSASAPGRG